METKTHPIKAAIQSLGASWPSSGIGRKAYQNALKSVQWRLRGPQGEFVGLLPNSFSCSFIPESDSLTFDGRDNEDAKLKYYESQLGPLTVEVL